MLGNKWPHTRRGLVSNGFRYATAEEIRDRVGAVQARWRALHGPTIVDLEGARRAKESRVEPEGRSPL